jgi:succinate dehydrogenase/fumarate reductase cytochrome b subunit
MTTYLFLGIGVWCLYHAWRGIVPDIWNSGNKLEIGKPMRISTRLIFAIGGVLLTGLGIVLWFHVQAK